MSRILTKSSSLVLKASFHYDEVFRHFLPIHGQGDWQSTEPTEPSS